MAERHLPLAGTWNVRHVGGYPAGGGQRVADGLLWRGDALGAIDDAGRRTLAELGLRTVVDLREQGERDARPNLLAGVGSVEVAVPLYGGVRLDLTAGEQWAGVREGDLTGLYRHWVAEHGAEIAAAVAAIARPGGLPALVHCTAGKDRTGVVVALLLSALGVPDDEVIADFALTETYLDDAFVASVRHTVAAAAVGGALGEPVEIHERVLRGSDPAWIAPALADVRASHGDAATYLIDHGLDPQALAGLRLALITTDHEAHQEITHA